MKSFQRNVINWSERGSRLQMQLVVMQREVWPCIMLLVEHPSQYGMKSYTLLLSEGTCYLHFLHKGTHCESSCAICCLHITCFLFLCFACLDLRQFCSAIYLYWILFISLQGYFPIFHGSSFSSFYPTYYFPSRDYRKLYVIYFQNK